MKGILSNETKKGSPPSAPASYQPSKKGSSPSYAQPPAAGPALQPPPPPQRYFSYHGAPPPQSHYDHMSHPPPPSSDRPGPYTTAQYDVRKMAPQYGQAGSSPPSAVGRDPPPPHHYSMEHSHTHPPHHSAYYRDEHRRWPPPHHPPGEAYPPRYYESSYSNSQYPPPPPHPVDHVGPYRYSDPTLRREAVSRLSSSNPERINDVDGREGATSPSQIESTHREEVTTMGCTCKKTKCLKLYCQCFAVKIYCGSNCRCLICHNTVKFEKERKDAIHSILSRNPSAFDTKFKKSLQDKAIPDRMLSHKLGCKCRKSACMKKYCECYAGNVKCSASCRCVGCKNMPRGGLPPAPTSSVGLVRESNMDEEEDPVNGKKREPRMMNAAQNLAFLKHGSPAADKHPMRSESIGSSMPSLASEESPPTDKNGMKTLSVAGQAVTSSEKTAIHALLMAAMASTETSAQNTQVTTPPRAAAKSDGAQEEETIETPQKNLIGLFRSPKRKQSQTEANPQDTTTETLNDVGPMRSSIDSSPSATSDDESPKREHPGDETPSNKQQKVKRSRIGSLKKGPRIMDDGMVEEPAKRPLFGSTGTNGDSMETPKAKGEGKKNELTPVSARCLDFKRMHVNEAKAESAIDSIAK